MDCLVHFVNPTGASTVLPQETELKGLIIDVIQDNETW